MRCLCFLAALWIVAAIPAYSGKLDRMLVTEAAARYKDPLVARADGYIELPGTSCITAASLGADPSSGVVGRVLVHPDRLSLYNVGGRIVTDSVWVNWVDPGVLIYEPRADGALTLVGLANIVSPQAWAAFGYVTAPVTAGHDWTLVEDDPLTEIDEAYGFAPHFTLRIWLFRDNPSGLYADFNPKVGCDGDGTGLN